MVAYAVVEFTVDYIVDIVPCLWLQYGMCSWLPYSKEKLTAAKKAEHPQKMWK